MPKRKTNQSKKRRQPRRKQRGGSTGTAGDLGTLADDIMGVATSIGSTIWDSIGLLKDVVMIPSDLGTAFSDSGAPGVNNP